MEVVRKNPLPAVIIGVGIGWLLMSARRQHVPQKRVSQSNDNLNLANRPNGSGPNGSGPNRDDSSTGGKIKESLSNAGEAVRHVASDAKEKVTDLATTTKARAGDTYSSLDTWVQDNPLAAGACALLVGAAVGLMIPSTRKENEWFGAKRDDLAHQAADRAHELVDKVQHVAKSALDTTKTAIGDVTEQIKSEVKQEAQNQGLTPSIA